MTCDEQRLANIVETAIIDAFDARPILRFCDAADQDGYDGGIVCTDGEVNGWGPTRQAAEIDFQKRVNAGADTRRQ